MKYLDMNTIDDRSEKIDEDLLQGLSKNERNEYLCSNILKEHIIDLSFFYEGTGSQDNQPVDNVYE